MAMDLKSPNENGLSIYGKRTTKRAALLRGAFKEKKGKLRIFYMLVVVAHLTDEPPLISRSILLFALVFFMFP